MKKIGIVTTSRADFGLLYPIINILDNSEDFEVRVIATGLHLLKDYGDTLQYVKSKCKIVDKVDLFMQGNDEYSLVKGIGIGFMSFSDYLNDKKFEAIVVLGDRTELIVPVYSAMICRIPIVHIFGGDSIDNYVTYDNNVRHCITKLANIHFTATEEHATRIKRMGEEEWRIFNVGSPAIDYINQCNYISKSKLQKTFKKINFNKPYCILTFHPVPLEMENIETYIKNIIESLNVSNIQVICTKPNNDLGNEIILDKIKNENEKNNKFLLVNTITQDEYYSLLKYCNFIIGNSSSGILESTSFSKPTINIGNRQLGRIRAENIIDSSYDKNEIIKCIKKCIFDNEFKNLCYNCENPYGTGDASGKILRILSNVLDDKEKLLLKKIIY